MESVLCSYHPLLFIMTRHQNHNVWGGGMLQVEVWGGLKPRHFHITKSKAPSAKPETWPHSDALRCPSCLYSGNMRNGDVKSPGGPGNNR